MKKTLFLVCLAMTAVIHSRAQEAKVFPQDSIPYVMNAAGRLLIGDNVPLEPETAAKMYAALAHQGYAPAKTKLGQIFLNGNLGKKNSKKAFELFSEAAGENEPTALYELGRMCQFGIYAPRDYSKAMAYYRQALIFGNTRAYYNVGYLYYKGLGVEQDYAKAEEYLLKGADKGSPACAYLLACYYASDCSGEPDRKKAEHYMSLAAKGGHGFAQHAAVSGVLDSIFHQSQKRIRARAKNKGMKRVPRTAYAPVTNLLTGTWKGTLYTYDWSGKNVLEERRVEMDITADGDSLLVQWNDENALVKSFRPVKKNDTFFVNKDFRPNDRSKTWAVATVNITAYSDNSIAMALHAIKTNDREPMFPMIAEMSRTETTSTDINAIADVQGDHVAVNGNSVQVTIRAEEQKEVRVDVINPAGQMVKTQQERVTQGYNTFGIAIDAPRGQYIIRVGGLRKTRVFNITI